jgi:hypothetical protein
MKTHTSDRPARLRGRKVASRALALLLILVGAAASARATTYDVPPGASIQPYIDAAQYGDTIQLQAGATYVGPVTLRYKTHPDPYRTDYITIVTAGAYVNFPRGVRVSPANAGAMAKIVSPGSGLPAIRTEPRAHHYRLVGLEVTLQNEQAFVYNLINLGSFGAEQDTLEEVPHHLEIDRCYIHGLPGVYLKRGIELNSRLTDIMNSYISECHAVGQDAQAILGWNGPGPFTIANNYLEGSGENVMFGGAVASIPGLVPSDIQLRNNHFFKPLSWRVGDPSYAGHEWGIKNLFELKNGRVVVVEGNLFENSWTHAQVGYAILFTPRSEGGAMPWATVEDVQFSNNIVRHAAFGIQMLGDDGGTSQRVRRVSVRNNIFDDISGPRWCGPNCSAGKLLVTVDGTDAITFDHNTVFQTGNIISADGAPHTNFVFTNNVTPHNEYGIHGSGRSPGNDSIGFFFPGAVIRRNVIPGAPYWLYPVDNFYPATLDDVGFVNRTGGDYHGYRLAAGSPYKSAGTDGTDPGVDVDALDREFNGNPIDNQRFFVYRHYVDVLRRAPEQSGWDAWTNFINGCPLDANYNQCIYDRRLETAQGFFDSSEARNNNPRLANPGAFGTPQRHAYNEEYVEQLYLVYLGRGSDPSGKQAWVNYIDNTGNYRALIGGFLYSGEYRSKFRS